MLFVQLLRCHLHASIVGIPAASQDESQRQGHSSMIDGQLRIRVAGDYNLLSKASWIKSR